MRKTIFDLYSVDEMFEGKKLENAVFLDCNFRNHPQITNLASAMFYGGMLKTGKEDISSRSLYVLQSRSKARAKGGSYINYGNAKIAYDQVERALKRGRRCLGVITPYKAQVEVIERELAPLRELYIDADIQVGTIHKFQGKEKEVIFFDLCFSPETDYVPKAYEGSIFSETSKLLNVAMTRAKDFFVLIGDIDGFKKIEREDLVIKNWVERIESLEAN